MMMEHISEDEARSRVWDQYGDEIITRPVDKRENFIKRCVAIAGDTLQVKNQELYINGVKQPFPAQHELTYIVTTTGLLDPDELIKIGIKDYPDDNEKNDVRPRENNVYEINMTDGEKEELSKLPIVKDIKPIIHDASEQQGALFPFGGSNSWSEDNYGPMWVPKKGVTIPLTLEIDRL